MCYLIVIEHFGFCFFEDKLSCAAIINSVYSVFMCIHCCGDLCGFIKWANKETVIVGDWKLASYHQRWYTIEKFDGTTLKYQVTKCVRQRDFNRVVKQWEEQYGRRFEESLEREYNTIDDNNRKTTQNGKGRPMVDDAVFGYTEKNQKVFRLGENKNGEQQAQLNTGGSDAHSDADSQGKSTDRIIVKKSGNYIIKLTQDMEARIGIKGETDGPYVECWCNIGSGIKVLDLQGHSVNLYNDCKQEHSRTNGCFMFNVPEGAEMVVNDTVGEGTLHYDAMLKMDTINADIRTIFRVFGGKLTVNGSTYYLQLAADEHYGFLRLGRRF